MIAPRGVLVGVLGKDSAPLWVLSAFPSGPAVLVSAPSGTSSAFVAGFGGMAASLPAEGGWATVPTTGGLTGPPPSARAATGQSRRIRLTTMMRMSGLPGLAGGGQRSGRLLK